MARAAGPGNPAAAPAAGGLAPPRGRVQDGGMDARLTPDLAGQLAAVALGHASREWPAKLDHVLGGPEDLLPPRALPPVFHGSFDWHSCVHAFWMLARLLRRHPAHAQAAATRALFEPHL